jgi:lysophospholipid acyltransferase (LPLAT)-like uncharacterized protein
VPSEEYKLGVAGWFVPRLVRGMIRLLGRASRLTIQGREILDSLEDEGRSAVLAFFHGRQLLLSYSLIGRKVAVMSSLSRDGELQSRTLAGFGFAIARGSASRSGARGLIGLMKLVRQGYHATVAVDGPKGPIYKAKPGAVYLAKKTGHPVVFMVSSASPARVLDKAWDRFLMPLPFSRAAVIYDGPHYLDDDMSEEAIDRDSRMLEEKLLELNEKADEMVGLKDP